MGMPKIKRLAPPPYPPNPLEPPPPIQTLLQEWTDYNEMVLDPILNNGESFGPVDMRMTFYAGAWSCFMIIAEACQEEGKLHHDPEIVVENLRREILHSSKDIDREKAEQEAAS